MTSPQRSLHPASGDARRAFLSAFEFVARGRMQLADVVGAGVGQSVKLEQSSQGHRGIEIGDVWRQRYDLDMTEEAVEVLAHPATTVRLEAIPDNQ